MNFVFLRRRLLSLSWLHHGSKSTERLGTRGERAAARHLRRKHFRILVRNYQCPLGEIDLVCRDAEMIVFVEVKTRSSDEAADLADAIRSPQWGRITRAARFFLRERSAENYPWRLDLVTVEWPPGGSPRIEHFEEAHCPGR